MFGFLFSFFWGEYFELQIIKYVSSSVGENLLFSFSYYWMNNYVNCNGKNCSYSWVIVSISSFTLERKLELFLKWFFRRWLERSCERFYVLVGNKFAFQFLISDFFCYMYVMQTSSTHGAPRIDLFLFGVCIFFIWVEHDFLFVSNFV